MTTPRERAAIRIAKKVVLEMLTSQHQKDIACDCAESHSANPQQAATARKYVRAYFSALATAVRKGVVP